MVVFVLRELLDKVVFDLTYEGRVADNSCSSSKQNSLWESSESSTHGQVCRPCEAGVSIWSMSAPGVTQVVSELAVSIESIPNQKPIYLTRVCPPVPIDDPYLCSSIRHSVALPEVAAKRGQAGDGRASP